MEQVIQALGGMLLRATPTFFLVLFLYIVLKRVFFNPLERILHERHAETEGAQKAARESITAADRKSAEYQQALKDARAEIYRAQEQERQQLLAQTTEQTREARASAEKRLRAARESLSAETEAAKSRLAQESEALAEAITQAVLKIKAETAS